VQGLARAELSGLTIHRCPNCRGIFLDGATFDFLMERQAKLALQSPGPVRPRDVQRAEVERHIRYIRCPVCQQQMLRKNYAKCSGVIFDQCLAHGVWLDDAELQSLLAFVATGGHRLAKQLAEEARKRLQLARRRTAPGHHTGSGMGMWGI
jgi:Zn-finger nucleic acid-binding protein